MSWSRAAISATLALPLASCEREERGFRVDPPSASTVHTIRLSPLIPGSTQPTTSQPAANQPDYPRTNEYEENAYAMSEGKRLFAYFNCVGCHGHGGGGMGPPLMDDQWIYGHQPEHVFASIVQGRPNGMPSFMHLIPDYQVWQLAAYVRSMSGLVPKDAAPARDDDMNVGQPENSRPPELPKDSTPSKSVEMPL
jgi:cytochrome c oxidase cbb3-type subunit III